MFLNQAFIALYILYIYIRIYIRQNISLTSRGGVLGFCGTKMTESRRRLCGMGTDIERKGSKVTDSYQQKTQMLTLKLVFLQFNIFF